MRKKRVLEEVVAMRGDADPITCEIAELALTALEGLKVEARRVVSGIEPPAA